ncbi:hypothetical protein GA0061099_102142 [Bradyrhizobium yuanmingense]|uniref:Uncharacterized protein n=1 Tax=Bradyrhizobium yuanmingense TaxID=108015 RepID=A0A1C3XIG9_9BRAD|nr:hypothetical protein [Bradyrhizobium yuanmingense]TWI18951.1 hypothetical protein IQ15_06975 [Bradyrhizobium yuanmingense]SCB51764.1 hypothetical protein GA0061099_102142 [Bradyrhizobium yuanmingense]
MKIQTLTDQLRNDLYGTLVCEHCEHSQKFVGYDDANWHNNVLPAIKCSTCLRDRSGEIKGVYGEMCHDPKICAGKGYCPRDPSCCE